MLVHDSTSRDLANVVPLRPKTLPPLLGRPVIPYMPGESAPAVPYWALPVRLAAMPARQVPASRKLIAARLRRDADSNGVLDPGRLDPKHQHGVSARGLAETFGLRSPAAVLRQLRAMGALIEREHAYGAPRRADTIRFRPEAWAWWSGPVMHVPEHLVRADLVEHGAVVTYAYLMWRYQDFGPRPVPSSEVARATGVSPRGVRKHLLELEGARLVRRMPGRAGVLILLLGHPWMNTTLAGQSVRPWDPRPPCEAPKAPPEESPDLPGRASIPSGDLFSRGSYQGMVGDHSGSARDHSGSAPDLVRDHSGSARPNGTSAQPTMKTPKTKSQKQQERASRKAAQNESSLGLFREWEMALGVSYPGVPVAPWRQRDRAEVQAMVDQVGWDQTRELLRHAALTWPERTAWHQWWRFPRVDVVVGRVAQELLVELAQGGAVQGGRARPVAHAEALRSTQYDESRARAAATNGSVEWADWGERRDAAKAAALAGEPEIATTEERDRWRREVADARRENRRPNFACIASMRANKETERR